MLPQADAPRPGERDPRLVPGVRRIAVLRANALGDFVFSLPALEALRAAYPEAEIVLVGRAWHARLLEGRASPVDRVIPLPHPFIGDEDGPPADPAERARVLERLRAEGWDLAIQLHGGGRNSNPIVRALGARVSAGAATPDAVPLDRVVPYVYWQHEVFRNLEIVGAVGATPVVVEPRLAVMPSDLAAADAASDGATAASRALRLGGDGVPLVVLHPGASDPRRRWPPASFAAVGDPLAARGFRVAITGTPDEAAVTGAVADALHYGAIDLTGRLDLPALVGTLASSALVVSNDTGPLHVAHAVGTPTVGVFWCGNVVNAAPPFRARHRPVIAWRLACPVCGTDCITGSCAHRDSFVADVTVADVLAAAFEVTASDGVVTPPQAPLQPEPTEVPASAR